MKWVVVAMHLNRDYYKVGEIDANSYYLAMAEAYLQESEGKIKVPFDFITLWCIPDKVKYKDLYKKKYGE